MNDSRSSFAKLASSRRITWCKPFPMVLVWALVTSLLSHCAGENSTRRSELSYHASLSVTAEPCPTVAASVLIQNQSNHLAPIPLQKIRIRLLRLADGMECLLADHVIDPVTPEDLGVPVPDPFAPEIKDNLKRGPGRMAITAGGTATAGIGFTLGEGAGKAQSEGRDSKSAIPDHISEDGHYSFRLCFADQECTLAQIRFEVTGCDETPRIRVEELRNYFSLQ